MTVTDIPALTIDEINAAAIEQAKADALRHRTLDQIALNAQVMHRARLRLRRFYLLTTTLSPANPWSPPLRWALQYKLSFPPAPIRSEVHAGVAA